MATEEANRVQIVVGIILSEDRKKVLLAKRPQKAHMGGLWEFPGGKQSFQEAPDEALARELKEELGIDIENNRRLKCIDYDYPDRELTIDARIIEDWSGTIHPREDQELTWVPLQELVNIDFPPANSSIIKTLQLPDVYFITPNLGYYDNKFLRKIEDILKSGTRMLRFRSTDLVSTERKYYASQVQELCRQNNCSFIYDGTQEEVIRMGADGIHLSSSNLMKTLERPLDADYYVAVSCHNNKEIEKANAINADFCVLAPVKETKSHLNSMPLGWKRFEQLSETARMPVYALGGMGMHDLETTKKYSGYGIAMISGLWSRQVNL